MPSGKKLTKEEELLLQDFSRNVSTKSSALFYGNAFIVSAIPICTNAVYILQCFVPSLVLLAGDALIGSIIIMQGNDVTCLPFLCLFLRLFWRIHQMDPYQSAILFAVVTLVSTWLVAFAYKNLKFVLKHKIAVKREEAVSRDIMRTLADDKKMSKKEKDERILWKKNEVADYEATTFSIFYNNALYLMLIIILSFYCLRSFAPSINYVASVGAAGGLLALFSTSSS